MGANRIGKIARGQMRVILFRHARVAMAKLLGYNVYWYAFIARIEPCLWRSNMPKSETRIEVSSE